MRKDLIAHPLKIFAIKNFLPFLSARFFFIFAAQMQFMLMSWELYFRTKEVMYLGYLSLAELIPAFILAFYGGYIVDKYDRKTILTFSLIVFFVSNLLLLWSYQVQLATGLIVFVMLGANVLSGVVRVFASPSQNALYAEIVPKPMFALGMSWYGGVWQVAVVVAPVAVGFVYKYHGLFLCQLVICVCMFLSLFCTFRIQHKAKKIIRDTNERFLESIQVGWKYVYHCKELLGAFALDMFAVLFGGAVSLLPIFAADVFKVGTDGLGLLRAATPIGTILTILYISFFPLRKKQGYLLLWSIFLFGVCIILFGTTTHFWIAFVCLAFSGVFDGINVVIRSTILQIKTTDEVKGKVSAIGTLFVMSSNELGALESSVATKLFGLQPAVVLGGCATIVVVLAVYYLLPQLKKLTY